MPKVKHPKRDLPVLVRVAAYEGQGDADHPMFLCQGGGEFEEDTLGVKGRFTFASPTGSPVIDIETRSGRKARYVLSMDTLIRAVLAQLQAEGALL